MQLVGMSKELPKSGTPALRFYAQTPVAKE
jgi:hypothetical protein